MKTRYGWMLRVVAAVLLVAGSIGLSADTAAAQKRTNKLIYQDKVSVSNVKRTFTELVEYLFRSQTFKHGVVLLTGTGVVPDDNFTIQPGDEITIHITNIGTLENLVVEV